MKLNLIEIKKHIFLTEGGYHLYHITLVISGTIQIESKIVTALKEGKERMKGNFLKNFAYIPLFIYLLNIYLLKI